MFSVMVALSGCARIRPLKMADLAEGRLRLDRLWRNGRP